MRSENLGPLALEDIGAERVDRKRLVLSETTIRDGRLVLFAARRGSSRSAPSRPATRGYDDLRRAANREPLGDGLRPSVASLGDDARMFAALDREQDCEPLLILRRLIELEREPRRDLYIER